MRTPRTAGPLRTIVVTAGMPLCRLDALVARESSDISRRNAREMVSRGDITVNDGEVRKSAVPQVGDRIQIWALPPSPAWRPAPDGTASPVVHYWDDHLAVVEKRSGVSSVPLGPEETGTLANGVVHRFPECADIARRSGDGGLLQRLDRPTSGAVLVARTRQAFELLVRAQREGQIEKDYLALVLATRAVPAIVDLPLGPAGPGRQGVRVDRRGSPARTAVRVLDERPPWALVLATIRHGVRHQIRAHLAAVGAPIAGDSRYGDGELPRGLERLFLHAHRLRFRHPITRDEVSVVVPLPESLSKFVEKNLIISF